MAVGTIRHQLDGMASSYHVIPSGDGGWAIRQSGSVRASAVFGRKEDALKRAVDYARRKGTDVFVHGVDGRIRSARSYGSDPMRPRG